MSMGGQTRATVTNRSVRLIPARRMQCPVGWSGAYHSWRAKPTLRSIECSQVDARIESGCGGGRRRTGRGGRTSSGAVALTRARCFRAVLATGLGLARACCSPARFTQTRVDSGGGGCSSIRRERGQAFDRQDLIRAEQSTSFQLGNRAVPPSSACHACISKMLSLCVF